MITGEWAMSKSDCRNLGIIELIDGSPITNQLPKSKSKPRYDRIQGSQDKGRTPVRQTQPLHPIFDPYQSQL